MPEIVLHLSDHHLTIRPSGLSEESFNEILTDLKKFNDYNLRSVSEFRVPSVNSEYKGKNSLRYFRPIIWYSLNADTKNFDTFSKFKEEIRKWKPDNCPCRLCKEFFKIKCTSLIKLH